MRLREPRCTFILFAYGNVCASGLQDTKNVNIASKKIFRIINRTLPKELLGSIVSPKPEIFNLLLNCRVRPLSLIKLSTGEHRAFCTFEPELCPALIYRIIEPKMVFLIFSSGKINITGTKSIDDANEAFDKLKYVLNEYAK